MLRRAPCNAGLSREGSARPGKLFTASESIAGYRRATAALVSTADILDGPAWVEEVV